MNSHELATMLIDLAGASPGFDRREPPPPMVEGAGGALPEVELIRPRISGHVADLIGKLDAVLTESGWEPYPRDEQRPFGESWSFGRITERAPIRAICRGFLEPVRHVPIVTHVPEQVALFLSKLPDADDYLDREHHDAVGWHYHYLDRKKRRSDVILCWDTRWIKPTRPNPVPRGYHAPPWPLFHETHGEGHARFSARSDLWGDTKRKSMHDACEPDLKRPIGEFRCAANKADSVWPHGAVLTPRAISTPSPASGGGGKKRR